MANFAADSGGETSGGLVCGEVAGFLGPSFHFGTISQPVLESHDKCEFSIEWHVFPVFLKCLVASVSNFAGSMSSTIKRIPLKSLDISFFNPVILGTFAFSRSEPRLLRRRVRLALVRPTLGSGRWSRDTTVYMYVRLLAQSSDVAPATRRLAARTSISPRRRPSGLKSGWESRPFFSIVGGTSRR